MPTVLGLWTGVHEILAGFHDLDESCKFGESLCDVVLIMSVLVCLLCLIQLWPFLAFFHSSPQKSVHQVVPSEIVCRMYVIQLLLTLSFPPAQHTNFFVVGLTIFKSCSM